MAEVVDIPNLKPDLNPGATAEAPVILAEFNDYVGLIQALRARVKERRIVISELDNITGLGDRYSCKVLSPTLAAGGPHQRSFGLRSLGPVLQALGLKLHLVEDPDAMARYLSRVKTLDRKRA